MGLAGISASLAALASTHGEYFFAYQSIVQLLLLTLSTVYYPIETVQKYLPVYVISLVSANPLSQAAEAMRDYAFAGNPIQASVLLSILLASVPFTAIGAVSYVSALKQVQKKGKL
jgi:ABC-type polysaccharide/polyol phosphate export permease